VGFKDQGRPPPASLAPVEAGVGVRGRFADLLPPRVAGAIVSGLGEPASPDNPLHLGFPACYSPLQHLRVESITGRSVSSFAEGYGGRDGSQDGGTCRGGSGDRGRASHVGGSRGGSLTGDSCRDGSVRLQEIYGVICAALRDGAADQAVPPPRQPINWPKSLLTEPSPMINFYQQTRQASSLRSTLKFGGFLFSSLLSSRGGKL
jgi:hypothetical protein